MSPEVEQLQQLVDDLRKNCSSELPDKARTTLNNAVTLLNIANDQLRDNQSNRASHRIYSPPISIQEFNGKEGGSWKRRRTTSIKEGGKNDLAQSFLRSIPRAKDWHEKRKEMALGTPEIFSQWIESLLIASRREKYSGRTDTLARLEAYAKEIDDTSQIDMDGMTYISKSFVLLSYCILLENTGHEWETIRRICKQSGIGGDKDYVGRILKAVRRAHRLIDRLCGAGWTLYRATELFFLCGMRPYRYAKVLRQDNEDQIFEYLRHPDYVGQNDRDNPYIFCSIPAIISKSERVYSFEEVAKALGYSYHLPAFSAGRVGPPPWPSDFSSLGSQPCDSLPEVFPAGIAQIPDGLSGNNHRMHLVSTKSSARTGQSLETDENLPVTLGRSRSTQSTTFAVHDQAKTLDRSSFYSVVMNTQYDSQSYSALSNIDRWTPYELSKEVLRHIIEKGFDIQSSKIWFGAPAGRKNVISIRLPELLSREFVSYNSMSSFVNLGVDSDPLRMRIRILPLDVLRDVIRRQGLGRIFYNRGPQALFLTICVLDKSLEKELQDRSITEQSFH